MKEEKTKKRKLLYYLVLAISVLLLTAATVLTVYFVSEDSGNIAEEPPQGTPVEPDEPKEPDGPTGGETVTFCLPVEYEDVTVYNKIYRSATTGFIYRHQGVDFVAAEGTKVVAIADGTVTQISLSQRNGNLVTIDHGDGVMSYYKFVEPSSALKVGMQVTKGQTFATVAAAYGPEAKDGTHLHFEMTVNKVLADPASYLDIQDEEK